MHLNFSLCSSSSFGYLAISFLNLLLLGYIDQSASSIALITSA